ncbi:hypothetical protein MRY87_02925 [bacterium]|nr:hypothetical protein [bacterium]
MKISTESPEAPLPFETVMSSLPELRDTVILASASALARIFEEKEILTRAGQNFLSELPRREDPETPWEVQTHSLTYRIRELPIGGHEFAEIALHSQEGADYPAVPILALRIRGNGEPLRIQRSSATTDRGELSNEQQLRLLKGDSIPENNAFPVLTRYLGNLTLALLPLVNHLFQENAHSIPLTLTDWALALDEEAARRDLTLLEE